MASGNARAWLEIDLPTSLSSAALVRYFMETVKGTLAANALSKLPEAGTLHGRNLISHRGDFGAPGERWGSIAILPGKALARGRLVAWSESEWTRTLGSLETLPMQIECKISTIHQFGTPGAGDQLAFGVSQSTAGAYSRFFVTRVLEGNGGHQSNDDLPKWRDIFVRFLREFPIGVSHGFVADDDSASEGATPLELELGRGEMEWAASGLLRQYSWVTFVPPDGLNLLGGVESLRGSGAFSNVLDLAARGAVAIATELPNEYRDDSVAKVFRAFAPALPAGQLFQPLEYRDPYKLVYEDAGQYGGKPIPE